MTTHHVRDRDGDSTPIDRVATLTPQLGTLQLGSLPLDSRAPSPGDNLAATAPFCDMPPIDCGADDNDNDNGEDEDMGLDPLVLADDDSGEEDGFAMSPLHCLKSFVACSSHALPSEQHCGPHTSSTPGIVSLWDVSMPHPSLAATALGRGGSAAVRGGSMSLHQSTMSLSASAEHSPVSGFRGMPSCASLVTAQPTPSVTPFSGGLTVDTRCSSASDTPTPAAHGKVADCPTPIIDLLPPPVSSSVPVAIKTIHEQDDARVEAGRRELAFARRYLSAINDADAVAPLPRVVHVFRVSRNAAAKETTVVMERLPGTTVTQIPVLAAVRAAAQQKDTTTSSAAAAAAASSRRVVDEELRRVAADSLEGLRVLHDELQVVHRDVKPSNLLLDHAGRAKVADFGVSALLPPTVSTVAANAAASAAGLPTDQLGTFGYMAPERLRGEAHGPASDVWSLGVTLLELALGRHPFATGRAAGAGFWETASAVGALSGCACAREEDAAAAVRAALEACEQQSVGVTSGFARFVKRCLASDSSSRPSAAALLRDPWLASEPR